MTTVQNIYDYIDSFAPFETAMDFDNAGMLVGNMQAPVTNALLVLDITKAVIKEAATLGVQLIISHHPVIFHPMRTLSSTSIPYLLAQAGIAAICAHTNLDLTQTCGVNTCLADALGLQNTTLIDGMAMAIGKLPAPLSANAFALHVKENLRCTGVRYSKGKEIIQTVAVSSGSGGDNVFAAVACGADALVTGEIKHNFILSAVEENLMVVDAGHYRTEDIVIAPLQEKLAGKFPSVHFHISTAFTDTIEYL